MPGTTSPPKSDAPDTNAESNLACYYLGENYMPVQPSNFDVCQEFIDNVKSCERKQSEEELVKEDIEAVDPKDDPEPSCEILTISSKIESDLGSWDLIDVDMSVTEKDLSKLLIKASRNHYEAFVDDAEDQDIYLKCASLFKRDYVCKLFKNLGGSLCWNYPENILIPTAFKKENSDTFEEDSSKKDSSKKDSPNDMSDVSTRVPLFIENYEKYHKLSKQAAVARCRSRFPVPVILYKNKFICRSGTLAVRKGAAFEAARKATEPEAQGVELFSIVKYLAKEGSKVCERISDSMSLLLGGVDDMKNVDVKILKVLRIKYICDLMVEDRKVHTGMHVSSSEKVNMSKYGDFRSIRIPFPGCEFFLTYSQMRMKPNFEELKQNLIFDWNAPEVNTTLGLSEEESLPYPELDWNSYETWDLMTLTKNYMKMLLYFVQNGDGGLLVHCISGWDRTPLFISLLRTSLWADGLIHAELDVHQFAYLTLGYDWYLFGHNLPTRLRKNEEILHYCFKFLPEIASKEYSIGEGRSTEEIKGVLQIRESKIRELSAMVLNIYEQNIQIKPKTS